MPLEWVVRPIDHGGSSTVTRFFIDMPLAPGKICMIKQVHVWREDMATLLTYDSTFALSADPDQPAPASLSQPLSRIFLLGRWAQELATTVGFQVLTPNPMVFHFPEGIACPYTQLPFFLQHSNTGATVTTYRVTVFFEYVKVTKQELAIAVLRRGRGVTRD